MLLIREIYESIPPNSKLILSSNNKIIHHLDQNTYCFSSDLFDQSILGNEILGIAKYGSSIICTIALNEKIIIQLLEENPQLISHDLRQAFNLVDASQFQLISRAIELSAWLRETKYCSLCGESTLYNIKEQAFGCSCSNKIFYPSISPCIITLITNGNKVLLGRAKFFPKGLYSTLAGFIEAGETAEDALQREVFEEVGVYVENIRYFGSQSWPFPSQLMLGFYCQYKQGDIKVNSEELEDAQWFNIDNLPQVPPTTSISGKLIHSYIADRLKL